MRSDPRGADRDPINLLYDSANGVGSVLSAFHADLPWPDNGGSRMFFLYAGSEHAQDAQRASACGGCDRYHVRFRTSSARPDRTVAASHYEVVSWCGHSSRSFDHARDRIAAAAAASGRAVTWHFWGNTKMSVQCDGYEVASDGWIAEIDLP
ncbi:MAG: hypothetical protein KGN00_02020 [Chloroflexota bacterium]|nr:hypothetical protein [Chloroflexota bacterium]MDE3192442.1 hypothetical protein [Chloroflexota bacterium]